MKLLLGIAIAASGTRDAEDKSFVEFADDFGFDCSLITVDAVRDAEALREWVNRCHDAGVQAFLTLDDASGFLGIMLHGLTNRPVLRIPASDDIKTSHIPAVATPEQAILHLARFHTTPVSTEISCEQTSEPACVTAAPSEPEILPDTKEDDEDLERLNQAFEEKSWQHNKPDVAVSASNQPDTSRPAILDYTPALRAAIVLSRHIALRDETPEISPRQLFLAFLCTDHCAASDAIRHLCQSPRDLYAVVADVPKVNLKAPVALVPLAQETMQCIDLAKKQARLETRPYIDSLDVMNALAQIDRDVALTLQDWNVDRSAMQTRDFPIQLPNEYAPIQEEEERRERIRPRKPLSTRELSAMMQQLPPHLLPSHQPLPPPAKAQPQKVSLADLPKQSLRKTPEPTRNTIRRFDADCPPLDLVETVCDELLAGRIVAMPTDTTYILAADATNAKAVDRLRVLKTPEPESPLVVLFDTSAMLESITPPVPQYARPLVQAGWPGPMILRLPRKGGAMRHAGDGSDIFLRQPRDYAVLAFLSMIGRPLATIDSGCENANRARKAYSGRLDLILDTGNDGTGPETIINATDPESFSIVYRGGYLPDPLKILIEEKELS